MSYAADAVEAVTKHFNSADMTEGRMLRKILREISPHINNFELIVLLFIFDRTYSFGKTAEVIPMDHFLNGVRLGNGELLHPGLNASKPKVHRALQTLVDNVIIIKGKAHRTAQPRYAINPVWTPDLSQRRDKLVSPVRQLGNVTGTHNNKIYNNTDTQQVARTRASACEEANVESARERLLATVAAATAKTHAARNKTKAKQNATGLMKMWEDAFILIHPEETYFRWRTFEQAAFKKAVERGVPTDQVADFVAFCVTAFDNVINEHFAWMKSKPTLPAVGFVTKHIAEFYQSFNDSKDPNRKLRGRIKRTEVTENANNVSGRTTDAEVERLKAEVAALKAKVGNEASKRRVKLKRKIASRPDGDDEFGRWDD